MMNFYNFTYRRVLKDGSVSDWSTFPVIGHRYEKELDLMNIYREDGSLRTICHWTDCEVDLGIDWVIYTREVMANDEKLKVDSQAQADT
jgi:hypothetical protein